MQTFKIYIEKKYHTSSWVIICTLQKVFLTQHRKAFQNNHETEESIGPCLCKLNVESRDFQSVFHSYFVNYFNNYNDNLICPILDKRLGFFCMKTHHGHKVMGFLCRRNRNTYAQQNLKTLASNDGFKLLTDQKEMDGGLLPLIYIIIQIYLKICGALTNLVKVLIKSVKIICPCYIESVSINKITCTRKVLLSTDNPSH